MSIKKHIPNTITLMNLLCGVLGVIYALQGRLDIAFILMLAAAVFDFCDGLAARLLKAYSPIGKELDSHGCSIMTILRLPANAPTETGVGIARCSCGPDFQTGIQPWK